MSIARIRIPLLASALLGLIPGLAHGQASPAPPPGEGAPPAPAPPAPAPTSGSAAPAPDPGQATSKAKAAGQVLEVTKDSMIDGCRDLGEAFVDTSAPGVNGRIALRNALKAEGRARGASHVRYSGHVTIVESGAQREHGQFYDCTVQAAPLAAPALATPLAASEAARRARSSRAALTGYLDLLPVGTLHAGPGSQPVEVDTATTLGVSGAIEAFASPYLAIGLSPGVVFGLKRDGAPASATQVDLRARLRVGKLVGDGFLAHGYVTGGASWIVLPNDDPTSVGPIVGFGAGVSHRLEGSSFVSFELGFQFGFQSADVDRTDVEYASRLFHLGFGFGSYL